MRRFAIAIVGYIDDPLDSYNTDAIMAMLNRQDITTCFAPLKVTEITVEHMIPEHSINKEDVSSKKLSQI